MVMASDGDMSAHELRDERPACQTTTPATSFSAYSEIKKLKQIIGSIEQFKEELGARPASRFDLYKCRNGDIVIKRKGDSQGPGNPQDTTFIVYEYHICHVMKTLKILVLLTKSRRV